jgi:3',5'-cyclic AMP phosphodiesterase CpdA
MRLLAHLSDLHFGRVSLEVVDPLVAAICELRPDVVVISGDLVENATDQEFRDARVFLDRLPQPHIIVPGNHDLAFRNPIRRVYQGLDLYRRYITDDPLPGYRDEEIVILGVNTARRFPIRGGRISEWQVRVIEQRLRGEQVRILVTHHPFDLAEIYPNRELVNRARSAMARLAAVVDLLLAGHMHVGHAGQTAVRYKLSGRSPIFVQAGTATSVHGRGEPNAFNLIRIDRTNVTIEHHHWTNNHFAPAALQRFELAERSMLP